MDESEYKKNLDDLRQDTFMKSDQVIVLEAEDDFDFSGNLQSLRFSPDLSNGKSINLRNGSLDAGFDILKKGNYTLRIRTNPHEKDGKSEISARLSDSANKSIPLFL